MSTFEYEIKKDVDDLKVLVQELTQEIGTLGNLLRDKFEDVKPLTKVNSSNKVALSAKSISFNDLDKNWTTTIGDLSAGINSEMYGKDFKCFLPRKGNEEHHVPRLRNFYTSWFNVIVSDHFFTQFHYCTDDRKKGLLSNLVTYITGLLMTQMGIMKIANYKEFKIRVRCDLTAFHKKKYRNNKEHYQGNNDIFNVDTDEDDPDEEETKDAVSLVAEDKEGEEEEVGDSSDSCSVESNDGNSEEGENDDGGADKSSKKRKAGNSSSSIQKKARKAPHNLLLTTTTPSPSTAKTAKDKAGSVKASKPKAATAIGKATPPPPVTSGATSSSSSSSSTGTPCTDAPSSTRRGRGKGKK